MFTKSKKYHLYLANNGTQKTTFLFLLSAAPYINVFSFGNNIRGQKNVCFVLLILRADYFLLPAPPPPGGKSGFSSHSKIFFWKIRSPPPVSLSEPLLQIFLRIFVLTHIPPSRVFLSFWIDSSFPRKLSASIFELKWLSMQWFWSFLVSSYDFFTDFEWF